jgi:hypothetical protein
MFVSNQSLQKKLFDDEATEMKELSSVNLKLIRRDIVVAVQTQSIFVEEFDKVF